MILWIDNNSGILFITGASVAQRELLLLQSEIAESINLESNIMAGIQINIAGEITPPSDDWMTIPIPGDNDFDITFSAKTTAITAYEGAMYFAAGDGTFVGIVTSTNSSSNKRWILNAYNSDLSDYGTVFGSVNSINNYVKLRVIKSGNTMTLYENDVLKGSITLTGTMSPFIYSAIGGYGEGNQPAPYLMLESSSGIKDVIGITHAFGTPYTDISQTTEAIETNNVASIINNGSTGGNFEQSTGTDQPILSTVYVVYKSILLLNSNITQKIIDMGYVLFPGDPEWALVPDDDLLSFTEDQFAQFAEETSVIAAPDDDVLSFTEDKFAVFNGTSSEITVTDTDVLSFVAENFAGFDGNSSKIEIPDTSLLSFTTGTADKPFTVVAWFLGIDPTESTIIGKYHETIGGKEWAVYIDNSDKLVLFLFDNDTNGTIKSTSSDVLVPGEWTHIATTYDGTGIKEGMKTYINGILSPPVLAEANDYVKMQNTGTKPNLGVLTDFWFAFGSMKDVKVFDGEFSANQILNEYNNNSTTTDLIGHWPLNGTPLDIGPNNLGGDPTDIVYGGDSPFTLMTWVFPEGTPVEIFAKLSISDAEYYLYIDGDNLLNVLLYDNAVFGINIGQQDGKQVQNFKWTHIAVTYDGSGLAAGIQFYQNGLATTSTPTESGLYVSMGNKVEPLKIGSNNFGGFTDGYMKDAKIFSSELTAAEILNEYNNNSTTTDLIGHWPMAGTTTDIGPNNLIGTSTDITYLGDGSFSISYWANIVDYGSFGYSLCGKGDLEYKNTMTNDGRIQFVIGDSDNNGDITRSTVAGSSLSTDATVWNHIVCTYGGEGGNSMQIYIDSIELSGTPVEDSFYLSMRNGPENLLLGAVHGIFYGIPQFRFNGLMKDVKVFDVELTQAQVDQEFSDQSLSTDLVGYWPLTGTSSDFGPNGLHATTTDISYGGDLPFTYSVWCNIDASNGQTVMEKGGQPYEYYILLSSDDKVLFQVTDSVNDKDISVLTTGTDTPIGEWFHLCVTYDGDRAAAGMKIYLNGIEQSTDLVQEAGYISMRNMVDGLGIGSGFGILGISQLHYEGKMRNIKLFNVELSSAEVLNEYQNQDKLTDLVGFWPFTGHLKDKSGNNLHATNVAGNLVFQSDLSKIDLTSEI